MKIRVNNQDIELESEQAAKSLMQFLREDLGLTGVKNGCNIGACGVCTILVDNTPVRACKKLVQDVVGHELLTIEGMAQADGVLHPLQQAFIDAGAIQCGFCTPGMVLVAHAFLLKNSKPTREQIRKAIMGNLCRCTGYQQIVDAIEMASKFYQ
jgi:aerobic carbon-monoxide dehydrogenase small subunit